MDIARIKDKLDGDLGRFSMTNCVRDRLMGDPEQMFFYACVASDWSALHVQLELHSASRGDRFASLLEGTRQITCFEHRRAEIPDRHARLADIVLEAIPRP